MENFKRTKEAEQVKTGLFLMK